MALNSKKPHTLKTIDPKDVVTGIAGPDRFEKTSWGDFAQLQKQETREQAQEKLVRRYHRPLVSYQMCKGSKKYDAEDMVQSFFAHAFEKWLFERVDGSVAKGLFRNWLLTCYKRYVRDQHNKQADAFNRNMVSDIAADDDGRRRFEAVDLKSPEGVYDLEWARELLRYSAEKLEKDTPAKWQYDLFVEKNASGKTVTWDEIAKRIGKPDMGKDKLEHIYATVKANAEKILRDLLSAELEDGRKPAQDEEVRRILQLCKSGA
jgi:DNA-directed RNA polymerase specialized sigma24 family protein